MKQKKELIALVVLLLIAGGIWYFYFDHDRPVVTADAGSPSQNPKLLPVENPSLHTFPVERARKTEYKSSGRNIFSHELPRPPEPPRPKVPPVTPVVPQVIEPPKVAPLPVK